MQPTSLPTIQEENERPFSLPRCKNISLPTSDLSSPLSASMIPRTPKEIHSLLQSMDDVYGTNFFIWVRDGLNVPTISNFLIDTLAEVQTTPMQLGSILQAITTNWTVVEISFLFKALFEYISSQLRYSWSASDWVPVLLSVTSPATIVQFMGLLIWNIYAQEHSNVHPILEVFIAGFGIQQTLSLIHSLDQGWIGLVRWPWKLYILKQWGAQATVLEKNSSSTLTNSSFSMKKRRASESLLNAPPRKVQKYA